MTLDDCKLFNQTELLFTLARGGLKVGEYSALDKVSFISNDLPWATSYKVLEHRIHLDSTSSQVYFGIFEGPPLKEFCSWKLIGFGF